MAAASALDCDYALLGTGLAPLVTARRLLDQGKSVLLLNPDLDYFLEDSELPLDPSWETDAARALEILRPEYPGALEVWNPLSPTPDKGAKSEFRDASAPHLRSRNRLWVNSPELEAAQPWEKLEALYLQASEKGFKPQLLEPPQAAARFPGVPARTEAVRGVLVPKLWDVDVDRYRNGVREFVRERVGQGRMLLEVTGVELMPEGVRFYHRGEARTARVSDSIWAFWTPRLSAWVEAQAKRFGKDRALKVPPVELWEQWSLQSREPLEAATAGVFKDLIAWAHLEGSPDGRALRELSVLKRQPPAVTGTLADLEDFCCEFLGWEKFLVRGLRTRRIFAWGEQPASPVAFQESAPWLRVVSGCDGPISRVVECAQRVAP